MKTVRLTQPELVLIHVAMLEYQRWFLKVNKLPRMPDRWYVAMDKICNALWANHEPKTVRK